MKTVSAVIVCIIEYMQLSTLSIPLVNVQLCGGLILPEVVTQERMMQVEQNIRITDTALNAVFCHIFNDRALTKLRLRRISADPRGLSSGNTFQSVLMR